ncbi:MAG: rRNA maturation RNase YbeY [Muribaculaceae bacterium]|nr:rRNA maturation RNase YbeY [Muribaculaceae bacterium]
MLEFFTENVEMPALDFSKIESWVEMVAKDHGYEVGNLTYCFCDDQYILDTNRKFLNHDYFTDIITFDYTRRGRVGGDMVISLDTVRTNAEGLNVSYMQELLRVIIHGVLHLCGINDKGPGEREIMEKAENRALRFWQEMGKSEI